MANNSANEPLYQVSAAQWGRSIFTALLPALACFLGGATAKWAEGIVVLLLGAYLILQPPRRSLGWLINGTFIALALCALASYLPQAWFVMPAWRTALIKDFGVALPNSLTPQPWLTAGCFASLVAALCWLYRVSAQELELRVARFQLRLFAIGIVMIAGLSVVLYLTHNPIPFWQNERGFGPFANRHQTADLFGITFVLILAAGQDDIRHGRLRWLFWAIGLLVVIAAVVLNSSRAGVIMLVVSGAIWIAIVAMCVGARGRAALVISLVLLVVAVAVTSGPPTLGRLNLHKFSAANVWAHLRWPNFHDGWKLVSFSPWTGVGLSNFQSLLPLVSDGSIAGPLLPPRNDWFWVWVELGFLGILLIVLGVALLIGRAWPLNAGTNQRFRIAALIGAVMFAIHGMFNVSAHQPGTAYAALFLLGLSLHRPTRLLCSKVVPWVFRVLGVMLVGVGLSWVCAWRTAAMQPGAIGVRNAKQLATIASRGRNFDEAITLTTRALDWAPLDWELYFLRATAELNQQLPAQLALADFRRAKFLDPHSYSVPVQEGLAWLPLRPEFAANAWADALQRAGADRQQVFRSIIVSASSRRLTARGILEQLAFKNPAMALEYLAQLPATQFHDSLIQFVEPDPELTKLSSAQKRELFHLWRERGGLSSLLPLIERHPDWLPLAWRAVASSRAAAGDYQGACALAQKFGSDVVFPSEETGQSLEQLRTRASQNSDDFSAAFTLYRQQISTGQIDDALATARRFAASPVAPAYFHLLEAQAWAAKQNWQQSWNAWVAFEKAAPTKR